MFGLPYLQLEKYEAGTHAECIGDGRTQMVVSKLEHSQPLQLAYRVGQPVADRVVGTIHRTQAGKLANGLGYGDK